MASRLFIYAHTEQDNSRIDRIVGIRVRTVGCKKSYNQMSEETCLSWNDSLVTSLAAS